jgi:hypothetical protein
MSCETVSAIPCADRRADCVQLCETLIAHDRCAAQTRASRQCLIAGGAMSLYCDSSGTTYLRPGFCQEEAVAARACRTGDAGT